MILLGLSWCVHAVRKGVCYHGRQVCCVSQARSQFDPAIAVTIISVLLLPGRLGWISFISTLQAIELIILVLLGRNGQDIVIAVLDPVFLTLQVAVVVSHAVAEAHAPASAVKVDDRPTL